MKNLSLDIQQSLYLLEEMNFDKVFNTAVNDLKNKNQDLGSSLVVQNQSSSGNGLFGYNTIEEVIKKLLSTQMQQMSFIHQIASKKWVYLGEYLEYFTTIYFRMIEKFTFADISNLQMLLCLDQDTQLFDFFVFNFGLDNQISTLMKSLRFGHFTRKDLKKFKKIDPVKTRLELVYLLRLIIQLCQCEVPFLY